MVDTYSTRPTELDLAGGINAAISAAGSWGGPLAIVARRASASASTYPSEILTCRGEDMSERQLLIKYGFPTTHIDVGHRVGVMYEGNVYRYVLQSVPVPTPFFYGTYEDETSGCTWLLMEYLPGSVTVNKAPEFMSAAAGWLGLFHASLQETNADLTFLRVYDAAYYISWARRAAEFARPLLDRFPWLPTLPERCPSLLAPLLLVPPVVIHGEFYPKNILCHAGSIWPVDWESAAVAPGLIDLVCLIDEWPEDVAHECIRAYRSSRWPNGTPAHFDLVMQAAQLYWHIRWLGNRSDWVSRKGSRFQDLCHRLEYIGTLLGERSTRQHACLQE